MMLPPLTDLHGRQETELRRRDRLEEDGGRGQSSAQAPRRARTGGEKHEQRQCGAEVHRKLDVRLICLETEIEADEHPQQSRDDPPAVACESTTRQHQHAQDGNRDDHVDQQHGGHTGPDDSRRAGKDQMNGGGL